MIENPRGTRDILPNESYKWKYVTNIVFNTMKDFGYSEILLPIFEYTELFSRGVGEITNIVTKEMYTFLDKGDRSLTLRPEATAGIMRSVIQNNLCAQGRFSKLFLIGPMFRHERPQKGRYRQFYQINAECLGIPNYEADVEIIDLTMEIFKRLEIKDLTITINSVGCEKCRLDYLKAIYEYFSKYKDSLCEVCRDRLERNPLRILDCKNEDCIKIAKDAPNIIDYLCEECKEHFNKVLKGLNNIQYSYKINKNLVRGQDYYTKTVFEILSNHLGTQNAVSGGGRYDNLGKIIGNQNIPAVGFGCGLDRLILIMEEQNCTFGEIPIPSIYIVTTNNKYKQFTLNTAHQLRTLGFSVNHDLIGRSYKNQINISKKYKYVIIVNGDILQFKDNKYMLDFKEMYFNEIVKYLISKGE